MNSSIFVLFGLLAAFLAVAWTKPEPNPSRPGWGAPPTKGWAPPPPPPPPPTRGWAPPPTRGWGPPPRPRTTRGWAPPPPPPPPPTKGWGRVEQPRGWGAETNQISEETYSHSGQQHSQESGWGR